MGWTSSVNNMGTSSLDITLGIIGPFLPSLLDIALVSIDAFLAGFLRLGSSIGGGESLACFLLRMTSDDLYPAIGSGSCISVVWLVSPLFSF